MNKYNKLQSIKATFIVAQGKYDTPIEKIAVIFNIAQRIIQERSSQSAEPSCKNTDDEEKQLNDFVSYLFYDKCLSHLKRARELDLLRSDIDIEHFCQVQRNIYLLATKQIEECKSFLESISHMQLYSYRGIFNTKGNAIYDRFTFLD